METAHIARVLFSRRDRLWRENDGMPIQNEMPRMPLLNFFVIKVHTIVLMDDSKGRFRLC